MFATSEDIKQTEKLYGTAKRLRFEQIRMKDFEYDMLVGSMSDGRRHDVTMFIECGGGYVGIQKPVYRHTGIFRAPSGAIKRGETLVQGLKREISEETGLEVAIGRFLLIISVEFLGPDGTKQDWTSYVFDGVAVGGELNPVDKVEISGIRVVTREEMFGPIAEEMESSGWGGFQYRARLTRETFLAMDQIGKEGDFLSPKGDELI
jgi:ADP-ribose pyrophosphatase YjhB (NUDIX family)